MSEIEDIENCDYGHSLIHFIIDNNLVVTVDELPGALAWSGSAPELLDAFIRDLMQEED